MTGPTVARRRGSSIRRGLEYIGVFVVVGAVYLAGGLEFVERKLTDARFRLLTRPAEADVVIVAMDAGSLAELDATPVRRRHHAEVLDRLIDAGAAAVAFDVDLGSRSDTRDDRRFERSLAAAGARAILPVYQQWEQDVVHGARLRSSAPLPEFGRRATLASIRLQPDRDGMTRLYPVQAERGNSLVPEMALALLSDPPADPQTFHIDYGIAADSIPRISYVDVLHDRFDAGEVRDRAVIVGPTAVDLGGWLAVPRYGSLPGCVVQALAAESLAQGRTLHRAPAPPILVATLLLGLLVGPRIVGSGWRRGLLLATALSLILFAVSVAVQARTPLMLEIAPGVAMLIGSLALGLVRQIDQQALGLVNQSRHIHRTETLMQHVVDNSFDAIVTFRDDGALETFNPAAQWMFGCSGRQALRRNMWELVGIRQSRGGGRPADRTQPHEALGRRVDGTTFPVEMVLTTIVSEGEPRRVAFLRDITQRKAQQELLEHQATHDPLTDLPNRYLLRSRVEQALADAREHGYRVAFLMLDLDRFKEINDTLGHHTGDLLLQEIAHRLQRPLRPGDTIARQGGDEFALLLPATDVETAQQVARDLVCTLDEPFEVRDVALQVETAVGLALFPEHGSEASELIQRADVAMYVAKRARSGVEVYDPERDFTSMRMLTLTTELRRAIHDDGLSLSYQPKLAADTGRVVGVEALLRWNHPEMGPIRPDEFIGLAEHSGLIRPLTQWVLRTAVGQAAAWRRRGLSLGVSVNISARNLLDDDVLEHLQRVLEANSVPAETVTLEITESAIMEDPQRALEIVTRLVTLGVRISIDDFGTGYSSLGYLKRLPARELKIDKSFVMEMDRNSDDATIVRSIIDLAHNLGLRVVAEGVEQPQIWDALRRLGCDVGQGYLFSRPVPADELEHWLAERRADMPVLAGS